MTHEGDPGLAALDALAALALCREERDRALAASKEHYEQWGMWQKEADEERERLRAQLEASRAQVDTMLRENDDLREQLASADAVTPEPTNDQLAEVTGTITWLLLANVSVERIASTVWFVVRDQVLKEAEAQAHGECVDVLAARRLDEENDRLRAVLADTKENVRAVVELIPADAGLALSRARKILAGLRARAGVESKP